MRGGFGFFDDAAAPGTVGKILWLGSPEGNFLVKKVRRFETTLPFQKIPAISQNWANWQVEMDSKTGSLLLSKTSAVSKKDCRFGL